MDRVLLNVLVAYLNMTTSLAICATSCAGSLLGSELNIGWLHWYGVVCWALLRSILLSSVAPHKVHGAPAPSVQPIKVFSVYHLHAPPPGRNVPLQWLALNLEWPPFVDPLTT